MKDVDLLRYIKLGFYAARGRYAPAQLVILDLGSEGTGTGANSDCIFHHGGAATTALHLMFFMKEKCPPGNTTPCAHF